MRLQNRFEGNQQRQNIENDQNGIINNDDDEEQLNCPMIFKTCLLGLLTCGILAFVITFGVQINNSGDLISSDYQNCVDQSNMRRLVKSYVYQKIILGLLISGVVISFSLTVFMIYLCSNNCECFGECFYSRQQSQQSLSHNVDIGKYQMKLRKRITVNILMPKNQINDSYQHAFETNDNKKRQLKKYHHNQQRIKHHKQQRIKHQMNKLRKSRQQIQRFNQQYANYINNSHLDQFDCQCQDCGACAAYCLGCLWCRSCFDAHHYHFYYSKSQQYTYWIAYIVKTFLFGSALAYVIRIYVSLQELNYCMSDNSKLYANNLQVSMIIGIVTAVIDVFGYIHLFVQGTLLDILQDTFHEKRKSQHSDHDSDHQSIDDHHKKHKKYRTSEQSYESENHITPKQKKEPFRKQGDNQQLYQFQSKYNLFKVDKNQRQKQPEQRDIDSFFIKLKTIGKKYLDNIESQEDYHGRNKRRLNKKEIMSEESYHESNKKPRIQVPQSFYKLPIKHITKMQREQPQAQSQSLQQSINVAKQLHQNTNLHCEKQVTFDVNNNELQKSKRYGQYGGFNKIIQQQSDEKGKNENGFVKLRKLSTQF